MIREQMSVTNSIEATVMDSRTRHYILAAFVLCVLSMLMNGLLSGGGYQAYMSRPVAVGLIAAALLYYGYVGMRLPTAGSYCGLYWGVAVGCMWLVGVVIEAYEWFPALLIPILCGAVNAATTGRLRDGIRSGLWCGVAGGLLGFLVSATVVNLNLADPNLFRGIDPDQIAAAYWILVAFGPIYCPVAASIGGVIGIALERTGRDRQSTPVSSPLENKWRIRMQ